MRSDASLAPPPNTATLTLIRQIIGLGDPKASASLWTRQAALAVQLPAMIWQWSKQAPHEVARLAERMPGSNALDDFIRLEGFCHLASACNDPAKPSTPFFAETSRRHPPLDPVAMGHQVDLFLSLYMGDAKSTPWSGEPAAENQRRMAMAFEQFAAIAKETILRHDPSLPLLDAHEVLGAFHRPGVAAGTTLLRRPDLVGERWEALAEAVAAAGLRSSLDADIPQATAASNCPPPL